MDYLFIEKEVGVEWNIEKDLKNWLVNEVLREGIFLFVSM